MAFRNAEGVEFEGSLQVPDLPEIAWQYEHEAGMFRLTWDAVRDYGLDPLVEVEPEPAPDAPGISHPKDDWPSMNFTIVAPDEAEKVAVAILHGSDSVTWEASTAVVSEVRPDRIDAVVRAMTTNRASRDEQQAFAIATQGERWGGGWVTRLREKGGFSFVAAHFMVEMATITAGSSAEAYFDKHATPSMKAAGREKVLDFYKGFVEHDLYRLLLGDEAQPLPH
jgi:hypothetical protein